LRETALERSLVMTNTRRGSGRLLHPDRRARQASWRKHAVAGKRKDPECHVLSRPDLLLDLVHFKTDCNFVGDAISVAVGAEDDRVGTPIGVNFTTISSHRRWAARRRLCAIGVAQLIGSAATACTNSNDHSMARTRLIESLPDRFQHCCPNSLIACSDQNWRVTNQ
jgi:hypothetical protein